MLRDKRNSNVRKIIVFRSLHRKNSFAEVSENLARYRSGNTFV